MSEEKQYIKPDIAIELTPEQILQVAELRQKQQAIPGMILGSLAIDSNHITLSHIPVLVAIPMVEIAEAYFLSEEN